jgi:heme/copper-type cytochrome/quinol oxidase subunit 3
MSTTLEQTHEENTHDLPAHIRIGRARAGVLMLILSDTMSVLAILAAGGYLNALNTENAFRASGDHPAGFVVGLLLALALVVSGLGYYFWQRTTRGNGGNGVPLFFILSLVFMLVALVGQTAVSISLNRGYVSPYSAYESVITLITWFTTVHLLLAVIIGALLLGRITRSRVKVVGLNYIPEVVGYWWYYTIIGSILLWLFSLVI